MKIWRWVVMVVVVCVLTAACGGDKSEIASINGKGITKGEFNAYLKFKRVDSANEKLVDSMLDQYLERRALADVIEDQDLLDKKALQAELEDFRMQMLISRYFDQFLKEKVTDQAVQNYYNSHAEQYEEEKAHVAHILIRTNEKMTEPERKAKLTTAQEAYSKIKAGADFGKTATAYSEDKISAKKGGDLGWIKKGSIGKSFSDKVFGMAPGEVSEPFETPFGYHVVKLIEGPTTAKRPFESLVGDIRHQLRSEAKKAEIDRLTEKVKIKKK